MGIAESSTLLRPVSAQPVPKAPIAVIGAALDLGSGRRGVDMGPSAVRYAQLAERVEALGYELDDRGNVGAGMVEALDVADPSARYWDAIKRLESSPAGSRAPQRGSRWSSAATTPSRSARSAALQAPTAPRAA